jgi:hypothetical protein
MSGPIYQITHSKVQSFFRCRKQFWLRYLSGQEWPETPATASGVVGTGVHRALRVLCDTGDAESGAHELEVYLRMPGHDVAGPGTPSYAEAFLFYERGCEAHDGIVSEDRWAEKDTWRPMREENLNVNARIDRIDRIGPNHWQIIDWKTSYADRDDITDAQLDLGHVAARTTLRIPREAVVTAIGWNLRTDRRRVRTLAFTDVGATLRKYVKLAERIQVNRDWSGTPGPQCSFCEWRDRCEEANLADDRDWEDEAIAEPLELDEPAAL